MAAVKVLTVKHLKKVLRYIQKDMGPDDRIDAKHCMVLSAYNDFERIRTVHNGKGAVQAYHIIQSWNAQESESRTAKEFERLGKELVERQWPGHAYVIATHTKTKKTHNHIIVSAWHMESGEKIHNKKRHLHDLRSVSNSIAQENGLSIIQRTFKEKMARLPARAQAAEKYHGSSWLLDLMQKADFARAHATNYNDYLTLLDGLGIEATVQRKNITYRYPDRDQRKRGSKLGRLYDKPGLEQAFRENLGKDQNFQHLRVQLIEEVARIKEDPTRLKRLHRDALEGSKPYLDLHRKQAPQDHSIVRYANQERIALQQDGTDLRVKDHRASIVVRDASWTNKGNRTSGTIIDFVAHHKGLSFVQAVAKLSNKPELLELEKLSAPLPKKYRSFYLSSEPSAEKRMSELFSAIRAPHSYGRTLLKSKQLQVHESGKLRFAAHTTSQDGVELYRDETKTWTYRTFGKDRSPFGFVRTPARKLKVISDPFAVLSVGPLNDYSKHHGGVNVLATFDPSSTLLDDFLSKNPHIDQIDFVPPKDTKAQKRTLDLFELSRHKYNPRGMRIEFDTPERERSHKGLELSIV